MSKSPTLTWADAPEEHDYPAAASYLALLAGPDLVTGLTAALRHAAPVEHPVKDLLRAAGLPLLPAEDPEVAKDLKKVKKGTALAPVLLVRGDLGSGQRLQIADGYHRVCAAYHLSENTAVPCRLVAIPDAG